MSVNVTARLMLLQISKAHVSRVEGRTKHEKMPVLTIEYSDFQDVQVIHDRINAAKYILSSNTGVCHKLKELDLGRSTIDLFIDELTLQSNRVSNLLKRTKSGSTLVRQHFSVQFGPDKISDARYYILSRA
jgi:hypothetical protein